MRFHVDVNELTAGWRINIDAGEDITADVTAEDLAVALQMAIPFMVAVANPDPLEQQWCLPPAQDGPPQVSPDE